MSIRGKIWLWLLFAWGVSAAWGALSANGHDVLATLFATAAIIGMLVVLSHNRSSVFGRALAPRAPTQRLGVILFAVGSILFAAGFFGHDSLSSVYDHAVHETRHYHWYDSAAEFGLWLAPIGAVLWLGYPALAAIARWIRFGR